MSLYDVAREVTDEALGEGSYAKLNASSINPGVLAAIEKSEAPCDCGPDGDCPICMPPSEFDA